MTPPSDLDPQDGRHDTTDPDAPSRLDSAASDRLDGLLGDTPADDAELALRTSEFDAVRRLMIDEPTEDDDASRDERVARAMATFTPSAESSVADLADRRSSRGKPERQLRPLLVAAAVVAVAGVGALALASIGGPGDNVASSDRSAESDTAARGESDDASALELEAPAEATTTAPPPELALPGGVQSDSPEIQRVELGSFDSVGALLAALTDQNRSSTDDAGASAPPGVCEAERSRLGARVIGIATVRGSVVVVLVIEDPAETIVLDSATCAEVGRAPSG